MPHKGDRRLIRVEYEAAAGQLAVTILSNHCSPLVGTMTASISAAGASFQVICRGKNHFAVLIHIIIFWEQQRIARASQAKDFGQDGVGIL